MVDSPTEAILGCCALSALSYGFYSAATSIGISILVEMLVSCEAAMPPCRSIYCTAVGSAFPAACRFDSVHLVTIIVVISQPGSGVLD